ncbi:MAG: hypothetical protein CMF50_06345 [Legionellales bacterium]|nr:hypothetical protein [Legionellales bacterium]|tara:strand:- start:4864 stop:6204 length:1341 start_codon:yes stop_codon:yes gene_type:complete
MQPQQPFVEYLTWSKVRDEVGKICSKFVSIIDEINPADDLTLVKVRYPFGAKIISDGLLNLPTERGGMMPITDKRLPEELQRSLCYSPVPLGFIVKNSIEVYRELEDRVFSIASWGQGLDIGIWEHFGWTTPYSITAGARSLYIVPRVTLSTAHKKLKRDFNITLPPPKRAFDHWSLLKQIANSPNFSEPWFCEVIFLSQKWLNLLEKNKDANSSLWGRLHQYIVDKNVAHSEYGRRRSIFEIVWEIFSRSLTVKGLRPNPYVIDTLKHLAFVGTGGSPGSAPSTGSSIMGPISGLQSAYLNSYGLKDYIPTIMQPRYLRSDETKPVYYSLQSPTLLESVPKSRNLTSIVDNVRELKELTDHFLGEAFDEHLRIANIPLNEIISQLNFEFFHEDAYTYGKEIRPSHDMPENDPDLLYMPEKNDSLKFADTSPYLHGCVRISKISSD